MGDIKTRRENDDQDRRNISRPDPVDRDQPGRPRPREQTPGSDRDPDRGITWAYGNAAAANAAFRRAHANGIIEKSYTSTAGNTVWRVTDRARDIFALFGFLKMVKKD
jgi:hypothetical protein